MSQFHKNGASRINTPAAPAAAGIDATRKLAQFVSGLHYEALPAAVVTLTKQCILDTLGVTLAASTLAPEARIIADYVRGLGGKPESTLVGFGGKAPASWAAFSNGSTAHWIDYDGVSAKANGDLFGHLNVTTVPVAFAIAEKIGGVSGRDLITAVAAGADLYTRVGLAVDIPDWVMAEGWLPSQLIGYLSGAATAGRLLNLTSDQMENALGIAFNQLSGSRQMAVKEATDMRAMQAGFSGLGAVLAAELAERGIVGSKDVFEGRYGFFRTYARTETPDWDALAGDLGSRYAITETHGFKVWPSCGKCPRIPVLPQLI